MCSSKARCAAGVQCVQDKGQAGSCTKTSGKNKASSTMHEPIITCHPQAPKNTRTAPFPPPPPSPEQNFKFYLFSRQTLRPAGRCLRHGEAVDDVQADGIGPLEPPLVACLCPDDVEVAVVHGRLDELVLATLATVSCKARQDKNMSGGASTASAGGNTGCSTTVTSLVRPQPHCQHRAVASCISSVGPSTEPPGRPRIQAAVRAP